MKNAIPKNDKKRRKQMTEEIAKIEADLSQKHEEELRQLKSTAKVNIYIQTTGKSLSVCVFHDVTSWNMAAIKKMKPLQCNPCTIGIFINTVIVLNYTPECTENT